MIGVSARYGPRGITPSPLALPSSMERLGPLPRPSFTERRVGCWDLLFRPDGRRGVRASRPRSV